MGIMDRSRAAGSERESLQPRALQVDNQYSHDDDGDCDDGDEDPLHWSSAARAEIFARSLPRQQRHIAQQCATLQVAFL